MELLERLGTVFSPSLFVALAGLSITAAALLYVAAVQRYKGENLDFSEFTRLSKVRPTEYRGTGYLIIAFGCFMLCFLAFSIFRGFGAGSYVHLSLEIADKVVILVLLFLGLCFLWAGAGDIIRAVLGRKPVPGKEGLVDYMVRSKLLRALRWLKDILVEDVIIRALGDWLTKGLFIRSMKSQESSCTVDTKKTKQPKHKEVEKGKKK